MKTFNQFVTEVQKPLSQGEKKFFDAHNPINHKDLVPGVTDQEHVFNGSPQRKDPKTASYEGDESAKAYDKGLKNESVINEISLEDASALIDKARKKFPNQDHPVHEPIHHLINSINYARGNAQKHADEIESHLKEEDDGWYAHYEMHGKKGVSKEDWKKGIRLNSKGERVQTRKEEVEQIDELGRGTLMSYGSKSMDAARDARKKGDKATASKRSAGVDRASSKLFPAMYKNTDKKSWVHASEEVEQIDELDRNGMVKRYAEKARKKVEYGEEKPEKREAGRLLAGKKRWGGTGGIPAAKVPAVTREEAELIDERNKENKFKKDLHITSVGKKAVDKFDVDHDKMAKEYGHTWDRVRDQMKARLKNYKRVGRQITQEEAEQISEDKTHVVIGNAGRGRQNMWPASDSPKLYSASEAKSIADKANDRKGAIAGGGIHYHAQHIDDAHKYVSSGQPAWHGLQKLKSGMKEEAEQIDEISKEKALNYIGSASYDKSSHASDIGAINQVARTTGTNDSQRKEREALSKKHGNRSLGIQRAAHKLAGKHVKVPATEETEIVNELDYKKSGILRRYLDKTGGDPKRRAGRRLALDKMYADEKHGDIEPVIKAKVREEVEGLDEGMPSSVIKTKQRYSEMSASDFAKAHGNKSEKALQSMAWSHGYGKPGTPGHNHYVDKVKKGMSSEELELDEAKRGRPSKNPEKKNEVSSDADQNIHTQLHKSLSIGKHVAFKNGDVKQVPAAHANKALHMLRSAKPAEREQLQTSMSHSHDRFTKTVTHGRAVIDHPGVKKISVAKSVKEALDPVGKEDSDIDNDGKHHTKSDKYLHNRRKSIKAAIRGAVKEAQELTAASVAAAGQFQYGKGQSGTENMQQDSLNKLKTDPLASKTAISLPPTQGNKAIGGESNPSRVGGKYSMEEEILLNNLYSVLSEENQAMFEELIQSDEGIEKLLSFAQMQGLE